MSAANFNEMPEHYDSLAECGTEDAWDRPSDEDPDDVWMDGYADDEPEVPEGYMIDPDDGTLLYIDFDDEEGHVVDPLDPNMRLASDEELARLAAKLVGSPYTDPMQAEFARLEAMAPDEALDALRETLKQEPTE